MPCRPDRIDHCDRDRAGHGHIVVEGAKQLGCHIGKRSGATRKAGGPGNGQCPLGSKRGGTIADEEDVRHSGIARSGVQDLLWKGAREPLLCAEDDKTCLALCAVQRRCRRSCL